MAKAIFSKAKDGSRKVVILNNRFCEECGNEFEPKTRRSKYCSETCGKIASDRRYKDKMRHGDKRQNLIKKNGLICSKCGKAGNEFEIIAHHSDFDKYDHENQVLLCRSCHAKEHGFGESWGSVEKPCEFCEVVYTAYNPNSKYCSQSCKRKAEYQRDHEKIKLRVKQWKKNNPEKVKANKKRYYEKHKELKHT